VIAAILPCRGRVQQTVRNVRRLLATAGRVEWHLYCVCDGDRAVFDALRGIEPERMLPVLNTEQMGYWRALQAETDGTTEPLLVNLANDLLPGREWLARGLAAYRARFGETDGLMGFNDGIHGPEHSPHFIISRSLLDRYGGWPTHYRHNYGDTELCRRAQADGCYGKAPWAVLYHDHELTGADHDAVYAEGAATSDRDRALFDDRRRLGWPKA
jgi:hypothetical protein